jgi:hypothetical protein
LVSGGANDASDGLSVLESTFTTHGGDSNIGGRTFLEDFRGVDQGNGVSVLQVFEENLKCWDVLGFVILGD